MKESIRPQEPEKILTVSCAKQSRAREASSFSGLVPQTGVRFVMAQERLDFKMVIFSSKRVSSEKSASCIRPRDKRENFDGRLRAEVEWRFQGTILRISARPRKSFKVAHSSSLLRVIIAPTPTDIKEQSAGPIGERRSDKFPTA